MICSKLIYMTDQNKYPLRCFEPGVYDQLERAYKQGLKFIELNGATRYTFHDNQMVTIEQLSEIQNKNNTYTPLLGQRQLASLNSLSDLNNGNTDLSGQNKSKKSMSLPNLFSTLERIIIL